MRLTIALAFLVYIHYLGRREQRAKRIAAAHIAAYARGQAELREELYQMKWGKP